MKKKLFFLAVAAVALASCSNDETIASQANSEANEITFRPLLNGVTRATTEIASGDLHTTGFQVESYFTGGSNYFGPVTFTYQSSNYYPSSGHYYWPATGNLDFYAYTPNPSTTSNQISGSKNSFTVTPSTEENPTHYDFIFAKTKDQAKSNSASGVPLVFKHICSWINVKVYNDNPSLKTYVTGWKVGYLRPGGVFTYPADGASTSAAALPAATSAGGGDSYWSYTATTHDAALATEYKATYSNANNGLIEAVTSNTAVSLGNSMILVPQVLTATSKTNYDANMKLQCSFIAIKLLIKDASGTNTIANGTGNAKWAIWPIPNTNWDPGNRYTYTINLAQGGYYETGTVASGALEQLLSGAEIFFDNNNVTVTNWNEQTPGVTM